MSEQLRINISAPSTDHPGWRKWYAAEKITENEYKAIHKDFLTPLKLKIDVDMFKAEIQQYQHFFKPWGTNRPELNNIRFGLPLVNLTGNHTLDDDISIGPLDHHNKLYPDNFYLETDFIKHTKILNLESLNILSPIKHYLTRSSILYWMNGANFKPHVDVIMPTCNLRLWGTNNKNNINLRYNINNIWHDCNDIENGRLYLIDTSIIHDASCIRENVYQFFISTNVKFIHEVSDLLC